jgi:uncharacterized protein (TIGR02757 family)
MKSFLDSWAERANTPAFITDDPVQFPRRYSALPDIEVSAFLAATLAWGRRDLILRSARRMFGLMGKSPWDYVMSGGWKTLGGSCIHRTFFESDLAYYCRGLAACYKKYGGLESVFSTAPEIFAGIKVFRETLAAANAAKTESASRAAARQSETFPRYSKHIANPAVSACKRINLALRWLVRRDGIVDLGVWKNVSPSRLYIPLDLHVGRAARKLGLLERKQDDRKAAEELTANLRKFCPEDPAKYDFVLFGMRSEE